MTASRLKQLLSHLSFLPSDMQKYEDCIDSSQKPILIVLHSSFVSCSIHFTLVYLLIDAFDECDSRHQEEIIWFINELRLTENLRLLLTSRPSVHRLREIMVPESTICISTDPKDIEAYLSARLGKEPFVSPRLKDEIAKRLATEIKGM